MHAVPAGFAVDVQRAKTYNTYIPPQTAAVAALYCHRQGGRISYRTYRLSPHPRTMTRSQTAIRSPRLSFNGLHSTPVIHAITWITTHLPIPEGWKAELDWLVDPYQTLPTSGHMSTIDQTQIRESPPA